MDQAQTPPLIRPARLRSLGAKLLAVTIGAIMIVELFILLVSLSSEQRNYVMRDVERAYLIMIALSDRPMEGIEIALRDELLEGLEAFQIGASIPDRITMVLQTNSIDGSRRRSSARAIFPVDDGMIEGIRSALQTLWEPNPTRDIAITAPALDDPDAEVSVFKSGESLVQHLRSYAVRILILSLLIAIATGSLVYAALYTIIVRPIHRLSINMQAFAAEPERFSTYDMPIQRRDEIGVVQSAFDSMHSTVQQAFKQQSRLATLGTAVTKINHDLKNVLSTALLLSDTLEESSDPMVARIAPRLVGSIEKATAVCTDTLRYTRDGTQSLKYEPVNLKTLATELWNALGSSDDLKLIDQGLEGRVIKTDRIHLFRVLSNLSHNAVQAGATDLCLTAKPEGEMLKLVLTDNGPGLPPRVVQNLFQPFVSVGKKGGTGLGLAIAHELTEALGGSVGLSETSEEGTSFEIFLPLKPKFGSA